MLSKKRALCLGLILAILILSAIPAILLGAKKRPASDEVRVYREATGEIDRLSFADYLEGCIAALLDPDTDYPEQALLAISTAVEGKLLSVCGRCEHAATLGVDFCDNPDHGSGFLPESESSGDRSLQYSAIRAAIPTVLGFAVCYGDELALTLTHRRSYLLTEDAEAVCEASIPYLRSVRTYEEVVCYDTFRSKEVVEALLLSRFGVRAAIPSVLERTASGRVKTVGLSGKRVSGRDFAAALYLPSTDFTIEEAVDSTDGSGGASVPGYRFTIRGEGNGVGLSLCGAIEMANEGADSQEILAAYYPGTLCRPIDIPSLLEAGRAYASANGRSSG